MKRRIVFLLLCAIATMSMAQITYVTRDITLTVGVPYTINPVSDLGITATKVLSVYALGTEGEVTHNGNASYQISNASSFQIEPIQYVAYKSPYVNVESRYYYAYKLTANKTGTYTFKQCVSYYTKYENVNYLSEITYNITVVDVTSIYIPSELTVNLGDGYTFSPVITDSRATANLTWRNNNTSVVTISEEGTLETIGLGKATITCIAQNGVSAQCEVTVSPVLTSSIELNKAEAELVVGEKLQLQAAVSPENTTDKSVTWSSTNETVAVVSEEGLVTAVGSGTCQIKATANDGSGKSASCLVTVEKNNKLTVTDMTQCSGGRGVLNVLLTDEETIMGFQFDLELPAGVTVAEDGGNLLAALTGNAVNTHSISSSKVSDGLYRFVVTPQGSRAISQANGDGMTITIDVADDVAVGTYDMTLKDIEMTVKKTGSVYEDIHPKNSTAKLTVTEAVMGDVNGDGRISVTDVISLNSYILEEEPAQFIRKVADMNGDGKVTITDMVQIIDIILGR